MIAELTANDAAIIIGAVGALVVTIFGVVLKVLNELRRTATETNTAVSTCRGHTRTKEDPTLRELVEQIDNRFERHASQTDTRHAANVLRLDRLADAVGGINRRLDALEAPNEGDI